MIAFVDMRSCEIAGARFAFYNTVPDKFVELDGNQAWHCWTEFNRDFQIHNPETGIIYKDIERFKGLCPAWVFDDD